jgi:hypothetical protein
VAGPRRLIDQLIEGKPSREVLGRLVGRSAGPGSSRLRSVQGGGSTGWSRETVRGGATSTVGGLTRPTQCYRDGRPVGAVVNQLIKGAERSEVIKMPLPLFYISHGIKIITSH